MITGSPPIHTSGETKGGDPVRRGIRYIRMSLHPLGLGFLHRRNAWAAAWWSVALPGLGHFYVGSYVKGLILVAWEIVVNHQAQLNLAIYHTLLGRPDLARQVLVMKWAVLYPAIYMLSVWDAYRLAAESNRLCDLEALQRRRHFEYHTMTFYNENSLVKRTPWVSIFWSLALGGGGHFYNMQLFKGVILMGWHLVITLTAGVNDALVYTLHGRGDLAHQAADYQWLLFWPSIYLFNLWNAYVDTVEQNRLYEEAALHWLQRQRAPAPLPDGWLPSRE